jgi:hypothetical protein
MKPTMNMTKIKISVSKGFSALTPWRAGRVLALGALLAAGTTLYFNMAPEGESSRPSSIEKMEVAPKFTDLDAVDNYLSADDLRDYVYPEEPAQVRADNPPSIEKSNIERLERQIDRLLAEADRDPSKNTQFLDQEIQRLEDTIEIIRLSARQNSSVGGPISSEPGGTWPPDTEYYLDPDYRERQTGW